MARKIVITSGKGGVGKTTVCANLGKAIADFGFSVALIDIDFGLNNLDVVLGLDNKTMYDIFDVLDGRCRVKQALINDENRTNLYVMPSNSRFNQNINGQNIKLIVESISNCFDYIFLDCPAGIDSGFHRAVCSADEAIVVATPNITSLRDADKVLQILKTYELSNTGLVLNRVRGDLILDNKMMMPYEIKEMLNTDLIGVLPEEDIVFLSSGGDLPRLSESKKGYNLLAKNIVYGSKKMLDLTSKYQGFFGSIRRGLKKGL